MRLLGYSLCWSGNLLNLKNMYLWWWEVALLVRSLRGHPCHRSVHAVIHPIWRHTGRGGRDLLRHAVGGAAMLREALLHLRTGPLLLPAPRTWIYEIIMGVSIRHRWRATAIVAWPFIHTTWNSVICIVIGIVGRGWASRVLLRGSTMITAIICSTACKHKTACYNLQHLQTLQHQHPQKRRRISYFNKLPIHTECVCLHLSYNRQFNLELEHCIVKSYLATTWLFIMISFVLVLRCYAMMA